MKLSLYEKTTADRHTLLFSVISANFATAIACLFAWPQVEPWIEPMIGWSLGEGTLAVTPQAFAYPFFFVWMAPGVCATLSWLLVRLGFSGLAWPVAVMPATYALVAALATWTAGVES